jgi:hypothetical protein
VVARIDATNIMKEEESFIVKVPNTILGTTTRGEPLNGL